MELLHVFLNEFAVPLSAGPRVNKSDLETFGSSQRTGLILHMTTNMFFLKMTRFQK